ncbi:conserved hypothetical protein [Leishmania mexicana MHOM/GT/2001/U1103]|uniref:Uncharacterized protein n=1 Tax=Leishmania mexicana (strain MHOM/GT/2001/U1103) TaxID=929439 RepID=E9AVV8_LEIMU|nr:conserved hypothetical protein [Leishmania mexicana MHOM/GT/2001/U1103]CBZ27091.1 conserved hypothetical protein [Leishmania mexicana MHOM/GT/2001/U1103]
MSPSLSTYSLVQCVVSAAQFTSGEISFYDTYAELTASDADGNSTSPLRMEYDVLEHFRIVRAQGVMRLTLPRGVVRRWAEQNTFETQLDEYEGVQTNVHKGNRAEAGAVSGQTTASTVVLLVQLSLEDMAAFMRSIAPLIAASRRIRSASRISVTEPLPVYGVPLVDPAASVPMDAATSPRTMSTSSASSQEGVAEIDLAGGKKAAPVCGHRHYRRQRQGRGERDTAHRTPSCTGDDAEERRGCASAKHSEARCTTVAAKDAALRVPETVAELLGGDSDGSATGVAEAEGHGDAVQFLSGSAAALAGGEEKDGGGTASQTSRVADALAITATATTGAAAQVDRWLPSPKHQQSRQATPSRLANTLEGVGEALAEFMEEAELPEHYRGSRGEPLHRRRPTVAAVMTAVRGAGQQQASRCTHQQQLPIVASPAAPSVCPSLKSISEAHELCHPHRQQISSAAAVKPQCEEDGVHAAAAADGGPVVKNRRSNQRPMDMAAHVQGQCLARVLRSGGGGAHLCASEVSFTAAAELPRLATYDACDDCAETQEGHAMPSPATEEVRDGADKAAAASGSAVCGARGVKRAGDGWGGPETQWTALRANTTTHVFSNAGKGGFRDGACTAPTATPTRQSSRSSGAASSLKLGDMLGVPGAVHEPGSAAEGVIEPSRRTVQFRGDGAGTVPLKPSLPYARNSGAADVVAYLRELFPVEETVRKPTRQRRKVQTATAAGSVRGLSAPQRCRRAPARRAATRTALATGAAAAAPNLVFTDAPDKSVDGATAPPLPVKAAPSPLLSLPARPSDNISAAAATRATAQKRRRSPTVGALGTGKTRAKVSTAAAAHPSDNSIDAAEDKSVEATRSAAACGNPAAACLTTPPKPEACSAVSLPSRVTVSVRDADALGLVQGPLPLRSAASDAKPGAMVSAFTPAAEEEAAAAYAAVEEGAAAAALDGDAAKVAGGLIRGPSTEAGSREAQRDAEHRRGTQLSRTQLVVHEVAPPAECVDGTSRYHTAGVAVDHRDKNRGRSSISSSQATCPLLYCRESRKERSRRVLRYMNLISQSIAAVHETHDALRGLLLLMMEEDQL